MILNVVWNRVCALKAVSWFKIDNGLNVLLIRKFGSISKYVNIRFWKQSFLELNLQAFVCLCSFLMTWLFRLQSVLSPLKLHMFESIKQFIFVFLYWIWFTFLIIVKSSLFTNLLLVRIGWLFNILKVHWNQELHLFAKLLTDKIIWTIPSS